MTELELFRSYNEEDDLLQSSVKALFDGKASVKQGNWNLECIPIQQTVQPLSAVYGVGNENHATAFPRRLSHNTAKRSWKRSPGTTQERESFCKALVASIAKNGSKGSNRSNTWAYSIPTTWPRDSTNSAAFRMAGSMAKDWPRHRLAWIG